MNCGTGYSPSDGQDTVAGASGNSKREALLVGNAPIVQEEACSRARGEDK